MNEIPIRLSADRAPLWLSEPEGVPRSAQADAARRGLAAYARPAEGARVLDLFCGTGLGALAAAQATPSAGVVACDANLRHCNLTAAHASRNGLTNVTVEHSDGFDHLGDAPFDAVYFYPPTHIAGATVRKLIAQAFLRLRPGGRLWLVTHKRLGGQAYQGFAQGLFGAGRRPFRREGCELACYTRALDPDTGPAARLAEELAAEETHGFELPLSGSTLRFVTKLNVFGWAGLDPGTGLLLDALPDLRPARVLDLGCGYGPIGLVAARVYEGCALTMSDVDRRALDLARLNADANGCAEAEVRASDGFDQLGRARYDLILSNLPTHIGKGRMQSLVRGAYDHLSPGGALVAVTGADLAVDRDAGAIFGKVATVAQSPTHRVFRCDRTG